MFAHDDVVRQARRCSSATRASRFWQFVARRARPAAARYEALRRRVHGRRARRRGRDAHGGERREREDDLPVSAQEGSRAFLQLARLRFARRERQGGATAREVSRFAVPRTSSSTPRLRATPLATPLHVVLVEPGDPPEHGERRPPLRRDGLAPAPRRHAGLPHRRAQRAARGRRLLAPRRRPPARRLRALPARLGARRPRRAAAPLQRHRRRGATSTPRTPRATRSSSASESVGLVRGAARALPRSRRRHPHPRRRAVAQPRQRRRHRALRSAAQRWARSRRRSPGRCSTRLALRAAGPRRRGSARGCGWPGGPGRTRRPRRGSRETTASSRRPPRPRRTALVAPARPPVAATDVSSAPFT